MRVATVLSMIGRPAASEANTYYWQYIDQIVAEDPLQAMTTQLDEALELFSAISEEWSLRRYQAEKWSIRQVLNHVTDTERAFTFRALWFARGFGDPLPSYDQNIAANGAAADGVPWRDHVEEFRHVRLATRALFRNLPSDAWMKTGVASGNQFTVRALAFLIPGHLAHHVGILRERYLNSAANG